MSNMNESDWVEYDNKCQEIIIDDCPGYKTELNGSWRNYQWN